MWSPRPRGCSPKGRTVCNNIAYLPAAQIELLLSTDVMCQSRTSRRSKRRRCVPVCVAGMRCRYSSDFNPRGKGEERNKQKEEKEQPTEPRKLPFSHSFVRPRYADLIRDVPAMARVISKSFIAAAVVTLVKSHQTHCQSPPPRRRFL